MTTAPWKLVMAGPAHRAIGRLPAKLAIAVLDFLVGPPVENPQRVGKALRGELKGLHAARVGAYRVVYEIDRAEWTVKVVFVDHRADVYRRR